LSAPRYTPPPPPRRSSDLVGLLLHRLAIEPARGASAVTLIIITIGASILLRGLAAVVFDKNFHSLPPFIGGGAWQVGGAALLPQDRKSTRLNSSHVKISYA